MSLVSRLLFLAVLALIGYFVFNSFIMLDAAITFIVGILIGGLVFAFHTPVSESDNATHNDPQTRHSGKARSKSADNKPAHKKAPPSNPDMTTLYIGNLSYNVREPMVEAHFSQYGYVDSVRLMKDKRTGKRKGFGFVEVANEDADAMIEQLNDTTFEDRTLKVRLAKERPE